MNLDEYRKQHTSLKAMSDRELTVHLWKTEYSDMEFKDVATRLGYKEMPTLVATEPSTYDRAKSIIHKVTTLGREDLYPPKVQQPSLVKGKYVYEPYQRGEDPAVEAVGKAAYTLTRALRGLTLSTSDFVTGPDAAERVHQWITEFDHDKHSVKGWAKPSLEGVGDSIEFIAGLETAGALMKPFAARMFSTEALRLTTGGGMTFMLRNLSEQTTDKMLKGKPISIKSLIAETAFGLFTGGLHAGGNALGRNIRWLKLMKNQPEMALIPKRLWFRMDEMLKAGQQGVKPEVIMKHYGTDLMNFCDAFGKAGQTQVAGQLTSGAAKWASESTRAIVKAPGDKGIIMTGDAIMAPSQEIGKPAVETFSDWAAGFLSARSTDTGGNALPNDSALKHEKLKTLRRMWESKKKNDAKVARREKKGQKTKDLYNVYLSKDKAWNEFETKTGIPVAHLDNAMMQDAGRASVKAVDNVSSKFRFFELLKLGPKDNEQIIKYNFSPETRAEVEDDMSPETLIVAKKVEEILQGPAALEAKEGVFRRWSKSGNAPPDAWNYTGAGDIAERAIQQKGSPLPIDKERAVQSLISQGRMEATARVQVNKMSAEELKNFMTLVETDGGATSTPELSRVDEETAEQLTKIINRSMKQPIKEGVDVPKAIKDRLRTRYDSVKSKLSKDERTAISNAVRSDDVVQDIIDTYKHPNVMLREFMEAKNQGAHREWIKDNYENLGVRKFYYMTEPAKQDIIDDYFMKMQRGSLEQHNEEGMDAPGTLFHESRVRKSPKAVPKTGSVIANVLSHYERMAIANAIDDNATLFTERLNQANLSERDKTVVGQIFDNILHKHKVVEKPYTIAVDLSRWFWKTRLSPVARPDAVLWMCYRQALQNPAMLPTVTNLKQTLFNTAPVLLELAKGRTLTDIDPEMMKQHDEHFRAHVSQRRAVYREHLLMDTGGVTQRYGVGALSNKVSAILEETGGMYGWFDEYTNRSVAWVISYQNAKAAASKFSDGKIGYKKFSNMLSLDTFDNAQKLMLLDQLDAEDVPGFSAEFANFNTAYVHLKYKTAERAGIEQTVPKRLITGIYTFPRGAIELQAYRGVIPMVDGVKNHDWRQAKQGAENLIKGVTAGTLVSTLLMYPIGKAAYDMWSHFRYTLLNPGLGMIVDTAQFSARAWYGYAKGEQTFLKTVDQIANKMSNNAEQFYILGKPTTNIIEAMYGTAGLNSWKILKTAVNVKLFGKDADWKEIERTGYQKFMHAVLGSYEYPETDETVSTAPAKRPKRQRR